LNRRTWAPVGSRPQQVVSQRHDRLSVIGSLSVLPESAKIRQHFAVQERNVRTPDLMRYLRRLRRKHRRPLVVVMDRLNVHRSAVRKLHERGATWLDVEWLPGYAPDLNPVEALWSHAKYTKLANFVPTDFDRLQDAVAEVLDEIHFRTSLLPSFFRAAKLPLPMAHSPRRGE
jgi:transposase